MENRPLEHKIALVTGASAGIGQATAAELARLGAAVVINARRGEKLESVAEEIRGAGGTVLPLPGDAGDTADIEKMLEHARQFSDGLGHGGAIDIVVVNAGRGLAGGVLSSDESQWEEIYRINVLGAAALMRRAAVLMAQHGKGDIVVLGSVSGMNISPFSGFYGSSKFAIGAVAEALRREICAKGVRVTTILPGVVESEFQAVAGYTPDNFFKGVERFGRLLSPADVAEAVAFVVTRPAGVHVNGSWSSDRPARIIREGKSGGSPE